MLGTPAAAAASGDRLTTEAVDLSARTLSNNTSSFMVDTATATELHFAAVTGSNDGEDWGRYLLDALVPGRNYTVSAWDVAPATDRRGFAIGFVDDAQMFCAGPFVTSSQMEVFGAVGAIGGPTETLTMMANASITGVRFSFYVGKDGDVALGANVSGIDDEGNVILIGRLGSVTGKLALSNGFLCAFTRRGTNNGTCTLTYKAQVDSFVPANVS